MDRRRFLVATGAGVAGSAGLAGCLASASAGPPAVPDDRLDANGWELVDRVRTEAFEFAIAGQGVTATSTTEVYENAALREEIAEKTLGQVRDAPLLFFAGRVTIDPDLTSLPGEIGQERMIEEVEALTRTIMANQMGTNGVEGIERVGTGTLRVGTDEPARRTDLRGTVPVGPISIPIADGETVELDTDALPVAGRLAVWGAEGSVLVGGGAFPAENLAVETDAALSSAISVSVGVDLGLKPEEYEERVLTLVREIE
jgi:hypothetical protein